MKHLFQSDLTKTLLYFILTLIATAALAPWPYNLGKMISEVTGSRNTSAMTQSIAQWCAQADFGHFFLISFICCALFLAGPFICWMRFSSGHLSSPIRPWTIWLPRCGLQEIGQPLARNPRKVFHWSTGFLLAGSLMALMNWLFLLTGWLKFDHPVEWLPAMARALVAAVVIAIIFEWLFRGILLGILLRSLRPALAIICVSLAYGCLHLLVPQDGTPLSNPGDPDAGFRFMKNMVINLASFSASSLGFFCLVFSGLILAYTRYRTASLSLSLGLQTGWLFVFILSHQMIVSVNSSLPNLDVIIGTDRRSGLIPLCILISTGLLIHVFTEISARSSSPSNQR